MDKSKTVIGLVETVTAIGSDGKKKVTVPARIDTGATLSAIDANLAAELRPGPIIKTKLIKSSLGKTLRPVVEIKIILAGKRTKGTFTIADRTRMKYALLIGQNILKTNGFIIDPTKEAQI